jgi:hypothetical protein
MIETVIGRLIKLHNAKLRGLRLLPNVITVIKSSRLKWSRHAACVGGGAGEKRLQNFCGGT